MKSSIRRNYCRWLAFVLIIHFVVQGVVTLGHGLHEVALGGNDVKSEIREMILIVLTDVLTIPLMFGVIWLISRRMLQPLSLMAEAAHRIRAGELAERIPVDNPDDDIGRVAVALNDAFDGYQQAMDRVRRFSSDASHQLRTPLTAMRSIGEVCLQNDRSPEEYRDKIASMLEECHRLSRIVEQLLALSRLERSRLREQFVPVDLAAVIRRVIDTFEPLYKERQIDLITELAGGLQVHGDAALLEQVVANLVHNAIRCTPLGGLVRVTTSKSQAARAEIRVVDSGPGIPESEQTRIFQRFVSLPGPESQGSGLGLAIVADIVKLHDGNVQARSNPEGGATLTVTLPLG
ncbi:MAG: ATP-binding protein [bacterium]